MFTVGAFARAAGVSAKVLRAWDEAGLFRPAWVDPDSRYRYYLPSQLPELRRVLALRDLGLSIADIRSLVADGADLRAALDRQRIALERERRAIDRRLAALEIRVGRSRGHTDDAGGPDVVARTVRRELVATFDLRRRPDGDVGAAFYELESVVRDAGARAHRPPGAVPEERLIWVPLRRPFPSTDRVVVTRLPETRALTLLHRGDYATLPGAVGALRRWASASGESASGPLRVLYLQFGAEPELGVPRGWVVEQASDFVTELQLPVA